jgi:hypothetical protein
MKYCSTFRPSRKFAVIGVSMIEPSGFGHQAAHARELPDLRDRAAGTRVRHHEDGVERVLLLVLAFGVLDFHGAELRHHRLRDVVAARPQMSTTLL